MEAVDEAMGFVTRVNEHASVAVKDDGFVTVPKHRFLPLCERGHLESSPHLGLFQRSADGVQVGLSAVQE